MVNGVFMRPPLRVWLYRMHGSAILLPDNSNLPFLTSFPYLITQESTNWVDNHFTQHGRASLRPFATTKRMHRSGRHYGRGMEQVIECRGVLDITVATQWCEEAKLVLQAGEPVRLKADSLQSIDTAGLQALLGLFLSAQKRAIPVQWESPSDALLRAARLTGLSHYLQLA